MWFSSIFVVIVIFNSFSNVTAKYLQMTEDNNKDKIIYDKYIELDKTLKKLVNNGIKMAFPYVIEANGHLNLSSSCANNLFTLMAGLKKLKLSAIKFLDAAGKIPPGLMAGTVSMFGDYDECLATEVFRTDGNVAFKGQYCMLEIRQVLPKKKGKTTIEGGLEDLVEYGKNTSELMQYILNTSHLGYFRGASYGLCIPSGCTTGDITMMLNYLGEKAFINATVQYCDQQHEQPMHPGTIVGICFFSIAGFLAIVGSLMDYYSRKKSITFQGKTARILMSFSIVTNFPKVISTKTQDNTLMSVFGIRTLSLFCIILMHQYFFWGTLPANGHAMLFVNHIPKFFFQIALNGLLTTEVFFFLGGLLNTYTRMKVQESGKRQPSVLEIIIHRLWRIYPTYIFTMLMFYLFINMRGPMATQVKQHHILPCDENWWKNLLFINNYVNQEKLCMIHTWYIAVDMQLFLISLFTVPVLLRNAKNGIILHVVVLIAGLAATAIWSWYKDLMPAFLVYYSEPDDLQRIRNAYVTTLPHIAPYFTGLICGYLLSKYKEFKIPGIFRLFGWPIAAACLVSMLFMTKKWNSGVEFNLIESVLYFPFCRLLYALAIAWLVVCCARGYGGILNYILSLRIWIPLARISYMVYMVSPLLQMHYYGSLRMRIDSDYMTLIWLHIGDLGVSCLMGLAMVVIVESPFISLEKLIFHRSSTKKETSSKHVETIEIRINEIDMIKEMELQKNAKNVDDILKENELEKKF